MHHTHDPHHDHADEHDDFGGLWRDLPALLSRRDALRFLGGASLAGLLAACGIGQSSSPPATSTARGSSPSATTSPAATGGTSAQSPVSSSSTAASDEPTAATVEAGAGPEIPDETAGPFPADGTNGPNVLAEEGVVRADLTSSFGSSSGTADGVAATLHLTVVEAGTGNPMTGALVYLWHCTADGRYSIYEISDQNYLRGAQVADDAGRVAFASVFPGCYRGRWPHCHFEVYASLEDAAAGADAVKTSQLALPQADCEVVYADGAYGDSAANLAGLSLSTDNVFRDGWTEQLATVTGSVDAGYAVSLLVRV